MKIVITGPTGFLGKAIGAEARQHGHELILLARRPGSISPQQGTQVMDWSEVAKTDLPPHDAAIHLAGESVGQKWTPEVKRKIIESRQQGTRRLVDAIAAIGERERPGVLVSASAVGYYGSRGDEILTEQSPPGQGFLPDVCKTWEAEAMRAREFGVRVVSLRIGVVMGKDGGALEKLLPPFKMGVGGPLGNGRQWFPWIHREDVVGLFLYAIEHVNLAGPVNAVSPGIVRGTEFAHTLGKVLHRPAIIPTPVFGLRLLLGEFADSLVESQHVIPQVAADAGYSFRRPNLEEALKESVS